MGISSSRRSQATYLKMTHKMKTLLTLKALLKKRYPESEYDKSNPSKTRYRSDYKPENPRDPDGVHFYDSMWTFNK